MPTAIYIRVSSPRGRKPTASWPRLTILLFSLFSLYFKETPNILLHICMVAGNLITKSGKRACLSIRQTSVSQPGLKPISDAHLTAYCPTDPRTGKSDKTSDDNYESYQVNKTNFEATRHFTPTLCLNIRNGPPRSAVACYSGRARTALNVVFAYNIGVQHHVIPQFYLRGFRDPQVAAKMGARLWLADFSRHAVEPRFPKSIACEKDYYKFDGSTAGISDDAVETELLGRIEHDAARVISQLRDGNFSLTDPQRAILRIT
jgi:Protein of unknown function (DUF4238)